MRLFNVTTALLILTLSAQAQRRHSIYLTEILVDPVGANLGNQVAEIWNDYYRPLDTTGWYVVTGSESAALPPVTIPARGILRIHFAKAGKNGPADIFLPTSSGLGSIDSLALYRSKQFSNPQDMVDFVSWNGGQNRIQEAIAAGEWPSSLISVTLPTTAGATIAHYAEHSYIGDPNSAEGWFSDSTPTLGLPNDAGSVYNMGEGCVGYKDQVYLGVLTEFHRPWVGEMCEVSIYNIKQPTGSALVFLGTQHGVAISMAPFGMPGCNLMVSPDVIVPIQTGARGGKLVALIPNHSTLAGSRFYMQALVFGNAVPNAARALMTNYLVATIGSR